MEQVIFVCTNNFVLVCVYVCKSAFCLRDNDCLCSPWNIALLSFFRFVYQQNVKQLSWVFTLEYCLCNLRAGNPSDCGRDSPPSQPAEEIYLKTMLPLFADLDSHVMSKDKLSVHNLVHEIGF